jgi:hypothetical protein
MARMADGLSINGESNRVRSDHVWLCKCPCAYLNAVHPYPTHGQKLFGTLRSTGLVLDPLTVLLSACLYRDAECSN